MQRYALTVFFLGLCSLVSAQDRAAISGAVTDPAGALVLAAAVELKSEATGLRRATVTSDRGLYEINALPVGTYTITITKPGFKPATVDDVDVRYGETRTIDARLEIGGTTETVEVTATAEALNRTNAEVGGVIESPQIKEIPISGRNWASLMLLAPGRHQLRRRRAARHPLRRPLAGRQQLHLRRHRHQRRPGTDAEGRYPAEHRAGLDRRVPRQHRRLHRRERRGGRRADQRGIEDRHQRVSRQHLLRGAQRRAGFPLAVRRLHAASLHAESVRRQLRRPIVKDKAFFYANYEGLRQSLGQTFINFVPNAAFRAQVLAKSPVLKPILDAYPLGRRRSTASPTRSPRWPPTRSAKMPACSASITASPTPPRPTSATTSTTPTSTTPRTRWATTT